MAIYSVTVHTGPLDWPEAQRFAAEMLQAGFSEVFAGTETVQGKMELTDGCGGDFDSSAMLKGTPLAGLTPRRCYRLRSQTTLPMRHFRIYDPAGGYLPFSVDNQKAGSYMGGEWAEPAAAAAWADRQCGVIAGRLMLIQCDCYGNKTGDAILLRLIRRPEARK